ncbi:TRAP-type mannitol/chloroaromatic compound transport system, small permease component [Faunimonas pinastri]|uniref:TRAP transporter small permease protein n=1 Tax=Faunimonas pinastri TaxID=1855383 RepID=A0A1H8ZZE5_9HYPH|nr:TRAP transporter small permease subunit [Faunimonas pinastri]SEP69764.1 TRAP-type mannitol/chloroaromatic compound transport system, small permease component [Faunimonas pinastri]
MKPLLSFSAAVDAICAFVGKAVSWLILATVLVSAGNAIVRKAFDYSSNGWLELQWYLFGAVFLLAAAYTLQRNEHIRIDILSSRLSKRTRDWIDLVCFVVMLLPFTALIVYEAVPNVLTSFRQQEMSMNAGGLIIWPAKALILAAFVLLFLQCLSEIIKRIGVLNDAIADPTPEMHTHPANEDMILEDKPGA